MESSRSQKHRTMHHVERRTNNTAFRFVIGSVIVGLGQLHSQDYVSGKLGKSLGKGAGFVGRWFNPETPSRLCHWSRNISWKQLHGQRLYGLMRRSSYPHVQSQHMVLPS